MFFVGIIVGIALVLVLPITIILELPMACNHCHIAASPMGVPLLSELGDIVRLQELRLANSDYSGLIPEMLGRLESLTMLSLENNNLTGRIPAGLSRLKWMYHLNLSKNGLDGGGFEGEQAQLANYMGHPKIVILLVDTTKIM
ncbi:hypothetical protein E2562_028257 [Oryza meyeriana var. granulata]|uniref:non-specific serine/threonine protein kinase n=1 Tax=Oryza meyeriana var. granulata TaxID=110450 RepID=A0A6G1DPE8_9ORYZ|nr:hypothetical protein E2562_028257 [Oryza meyeriana var. granulata]